MGPCPGQLPTPALAPSRGSGAVAPYSAKQEEQVRFSEWGFSTAKRKKLVRCGAGKRGALGKGQESGSAAGVGARMMEARRRLVRAGALTGEPRCIHPPAPLHPGLVGLEL